MSPAESAAAKPAVPAADRSGALLADLLTLTAQAVEAADTLLAKARAAVFATVATDGKVSAAAIEREQFAVHGFAWAATYVEALRQMAAYARRMA